MDAQGDEAYDATCVGVMVKRKEKRTTNRTKKRNAGQNRKKN